MDLFQPIFTDGCSITAGYGDPSHGGWSGRLKSRMMERVDLGESTAYDVINLAASSQSADQVAQRFQGRIDSYFYRQRPGLGIFMLGFVDSLIRPGETESRLSLPVFQEALRQLGDRCLEQTVTPLFVGSYNVDEERTNPLPKNGRSFINQRIGQYHEVIRDYAQSISASYIELGALEASQQPVLAEDGLHPNALGHELIFQTVLQTIDALAPTNV